MSATVGGTQRSSLRVFARAARFRGRVMGAACSKTRLEGAIAHWSLPSAGSRDKRVTLAACADDPAGPPFDHSGWTAVLQAHTTAATLQLASAPVAAMS